MKWTDQIQNTLSSLKRREITSGFSRESAVLIPIFERQGELHFLLTRRTDEVETHKGQISFPGGMRDAGEPLKQTALRETYEEVGLKNVTILGRFHDYVSITDFRVTPYVGLLPDSFKIKAHPAEVAEVIQVPFRIFRDPANLRTERHHRVGKMLKVYFYSYGLHTIWGLTARMIKEFLEEVDQYPSTRKSLYIST